MDAPGDVYDVQNAANSFIVKVPTDPSVTPIRFTNDGHWVTMQMDGLSDASASVDGTSAVFGDVTKADDVEYQVTNTGLKENIRLELAPTMPISYSYLIDADPDLTPSMMENGSIAFSDGFGDLTFSIPAGIMQDSAVQPETSTAVEYRLNREDDHWKLTVTPDYQWLTDPVRDYPVVIDPSISNQPATDCFLTESNPTESHCGNTSAYIHVGKQGAGKRKRGLLSFSLTSVPPTAIIDSAALSLYLDPGQTVGTGSSEYSVYRAGKAFNNNATWATSGSSGNWAFGAGDPTAPIVGGLSITGGTSGYKDFTGLNEIVQGWVDGRFAANGLVLKQTDEQTSNEIGFFSSASATPSARVPKLAVNYSMPVVGGDAVSDGPVDPNLVWEDPAVDTDPSVIQEEEVVGWLADELTADEDPTFARRACTKPGGDPCPSADNQYLNVVNHREGQGNSCTAGDSGCTSNGHKTYTCSAAASRNMIETYKGTDKGEKWFEDKLQLSTTQGLLGITRITDTLKNNFSGSHRWRLKQPSSAVRYQARVIMDVSNGIPVIQNVATQYLPYYGGHALTHYNLAYGYDRSDKSVAVAEEWDPEYTYGVLSSSYPSGNPYGLHKDVARSKAFAAVYHSPNQKIVF